MSTAVVASARDSGRGSATTTTATTTAANSAETTSSSLALSTTANRNKQSRSKNESINGERNSTAEGQQPAQTTNTNSQNTARQAPPSTATTPQTSATAPSSSTARSKTHTDTPLPAHLRKILLEVAQKGTCTKLPWNAPTTAMPAAQWLPTKKHSRASTSTSSHPHQQHHQQQQQHNQHHPVHRRPTPLYPSGSAAAGPPRKKHRNGLHTRSTRRFADAATGVRKRPLLLIRTTSSASSTTNGVFSPPGSSVGSGRTSGSEPEDTTSQYECDSEGTSATSNSELSVDRSCNAAKYRRGAENSNSSTHWQPMSAKPPPAEAAAEDRAAAATTTTTNRSPAYASLRELFRVAISLVLEHYYSRGGYKLSPAEKRRNATMNAAKDEKPAAAPNGGTNNSSSGDVATNHVVGELDKKSSPAEEVFRQRWKRVLAALEPPTVLPPNGVDPPFTIQRIAEVLLAPERYYTQTHKLCNCLEKLLLVTSSTGAFGGSTGGDTSQSRREEREMAALADEKDRLQSQFRQRRLRRRASSSMSDEIASAEGNDSSHSVGRHGGGMEDSKRASSPEKKSLNESGQESSGSASMGSNSDAASREMLEAAARASLRTKFDHVGIDPHHAAVGNNRDVRAIADHRGMTNSPPPPSLSMGGAGIALPGHSGLLRQHHDQDHHGLARSPSPILFNSGGEASNSPPMHPNPNIHLLQVNHAAAVAGLSPFELMAYHSASHESASAPGSSISATLPGMTKELDLESRSSASSDVDSESDVSFDDSASDRSDGSDSGGHYEPFSVARADILKRMQQQQRLQQTRMMTSLHHSGTAADTEYQSGDSIDSAPAEDSGGSDSSSSDMAD